MSKKINATLGAKTILIWTYDSILMVTINRVKSTENSRIQGLFRPLIFFITFQGRFDLQGLFKKVLLIQVLFKPVRTLSTLHKRAQRFSGRVLDLRLKGGEFEPHRHDYAASLILA